MDQAKLDEVAKTAGGLEMMEGAIGVVPLSVYDTDEGQDFVERYQAEYDKMPGSEAAYNYLGLHALAKAMELSDSTQPKAVRERMEEAIAELEPRYNVYDVQGVTSGGGFTTLTTMAVVEDGEIVQKNLKTN